MAFGVEPLETAGNAATNPLQCLQGRPPSRHLTENSVGLRWPSFQKTGTENIVERRCNNIIY